MDADNTGPARIPRPGSQDGGRAGRGEADVLLPLSLNTSLCFASATAEFCPPPQALLGKPPPPQPAQLKYHCLGLSHTGVPSAPRGPVCRTLPCGSVYIPAGAGDFPRERSLELHAARLAQLATDPSGRRRGNRLLQRLGSLLCRAAPRCLLMAACTWCAFNTEAWARSLSSLQGLIVLLPGPPLAGSGGHSPQGLGRGPFNEAWLEDQALVLVLQKAPVSLPRAWCREGSVALRENTFYSYNIPRVSS